MPRLLELPKSAAPFWTSLRAFSSVFQILVPSVLIPAFRVSPIVHSLTGAHIVETCGLLYVLCMCISHTSYKCVVRVVRDLHDVRLTRL